MMMVSIFYIFSVLDNIFAEPMIEPVMVEESMAFDAAPKLENRIAESSKRKGAALPKKPKVALRNYFPENWLFELMTVKEEALNR